MEGRCGWSWTGVKATHSTGWTSKKIMFLAQLGLSEAPDLPDVPSIVDLPKPKSAAIFA